MHTQFTSNTIDLFYKFIRNPAELTLLQLMFLILTRMEAMVDLKLQLLTI